MKNINDLPPALQQYVRGQSTFPSHITHVRSHVLLAKQLRKQHLRRIQAVSPGDQYKEPDYFELMSKEIRHYCKIVLEPHILAVWEDAILKCVRLKCIYEHTPIPRAKEWDQLSSHKKTRLLLKRKKTALRSAILDPRTLGEIEMFCTKRVFYGMPHWRNDDYKNWN